MAVSDRCTVLRRLWTGLTRATDGKLGQTITLPEGSAFNGHGEVNAGLNGSVSGSFSIPAFTAPLELFGVLPVRVGMSISEVGSLAGRVSPNEADQPGEAILEGPVQLEVGINSVDLLGLKIPTRCATAEPVALSLLDFLSREELLKTGWSFAGDTTLPQVRCQGGFLGHLFGSLLSALLSGPENQYSLQVGPPAG